MVVLPLALVLGHAFGGAAAWIHAHGPHAEHEHAGTHLHVLSAEIDPTDRDALHEWHAAEHRRGPTEHQDESDPREEPAPDGFLIALPQVLAASSRSPTSASEGVSLAASFPAPDRCSSPVEGTHPPDRCRPGWPSERAKRSGVATLLRSSHALLI
jgi:hypothetical protein